MSVSSMTGFARSSGHHGEVGWVWELKSVNGRGLEPRFRLPAGAEHLDAGARARIAAALERGNVQAQLAIAATESAAALRINQAVIDQLLALHAALGARVDTAPPRLEALLAVRGVVEQAAPAEEAPDAAAARDAALLAGLDEAVAGLVAARREEGGRLAPVLAGQLDRIGALATAAAGAADGRPAAIRARLEERLRAVMEMEPALPEERLAQEVALLVTKADVTEELDRLAAHLGSARDLLAEGGAIGRRLDFLCQELNREANTICSKAGDVALTNVGLDLKATIEQLREQVQNIE